MNDIFFPPNDSLNSPETALAAQEHVERVMRNHIACAISDARATNPFAPSITNTVTQNLVANAQLAVGGSAAMVFLPDEGTFVAKAGGSLYLNMGTLMPIYDKTIPRTLRSLTFAKTPWVLDPVGIGIGSLRTQLLMEAREHLPAIVRGNASEIIALTKLWQIPFNEEEQAAGPRGVDSSDTVDAAASAAVALARFIKGAVAVSGEVDLITNGQVIARIEGGSPLMPCITGMGCSLGGVASVYACVTDPFSAALTASALYKYAGSIAHKTADGPGSFQVAFLDALYQATPEQVAAVSLTAEACA